MKMVAWTRLHWRCHRVGRTRDRATRLRPGGYPFSPRGAFRFHRVGVVLVILALAAAGARAEIRASYTLSKRKSEERVEMIRQRAENVLKALQRPITDRQRVDGLHEVLRGLYMPGRGLILRECARDMGGR